MRQFKFFALVMVLCATSNPARATSTVLEVEKLDDLKTCCSSTTIVNVNVRGAVTADDGGGGQFAAQGASTCSSSDEGVIIKENPSTLQRCWIRQFSGPVHLPWYGVPDVADLNSPYCYENGYPAISCDAATALNNAFAASAAYGDGGVTTDGRSIALLSQCAGCVAPDGSPLIPAVEIPDGQYLDCARPPGVRHSWHDNPNNSDAYWRLPGSLVLDSGHTIVRDENTLLSNCFIRPKWLYPNNPILPIPPNGTVAQAVAMTHLFTGTATVCASPTCNMLNVSIAGYDICDDSSGANNAILSNIVVDCPTGEWVHAGGGGGPKLHGVTVTPILEGSLDKSAQELQWNIVSLQLSGTDNVIVQVNTGSSSTPTQLQSGGGDTVLISGLGPSTNAGSPVSANGRWLTYSVSPVVGSPGKYNVVLIGASWAGPTATEAAWKAGAPVITVHDNTNVIPGQYVCASGTPPLCTPPAEFSFLSGTLGTPILSTGSLPTVQVGSTAHWPLKGLARIGSTPPQYEYVSYTVINATEIELMARAQHGTLGKSHAMNETVAPAAPVVLSVPPPVVAAGPAVPGTVSEAVIVSAPAQADGSSAVTFANDTMLWPAPGGAVTYGTLYLNPSYHTWTANIRAGGRPSSLVTDKANGAASAMSITNFKDCWKAQPGMLVTDITTPENVTGATHVTGCSGTTLAIDPALPSQIATGSFTGDLIQLSGCGYPAGMPWLGNCAATGLLLGGTGTEITPGDANVGDEIQGTMCDTIHSAGVELSIHSLNGKATTCANFIIDDAGPDGALSDPDSAGLWLDGSMAKSVYSNGRLSGGANAILVTPNAQQDQGDISISNADVSGNIALGTSASATLTGAHGQSPPFPATLFASSGTTLAQIVGANLLPWTVVSDDRAGYATLACSGNVFATALCGQVKGTPSCAPLAPGCANVTGADGAFSVTVTGGATSVTVTLAGQYAAAPVCTVSPGGSTAASTAVAIAYAPYGTTITIQTSPAVSQLYGSCRAVTG